MPRLWPALALHFPAGGDLSLADRVLAALDDFQPTALTDDEPASLKAGSTEGQLSATEGSALPGCGASLQAGHRIWRAYFGTAQHRDAAAAALTESLGADGLRVEPIDEPDEDWARRSQEGLEPVCVGRFLIVGRQTPDPGRQEWTSDTGRRTSDLTRIVIEPSMGFGTGHHASTRLCLRLLQKIDVNGATVLDVGCGSGILAIAASLCGAARATGLDVDTDAVEAARRNLALNPGVRHVNFQAGDIREHPPGGADLVFGNLTGGFLVRHAPALIARLAPGGSCILSGILAEEEEDVRRAFAALAPIELAREDEWVGLLLRSL